MDLKEFESSRTKLEQDYINLEKEIKKLYEKDELKEASNLEKKLDLIDDQLDIIDEIIFSLKNTPKLYDRYLELNKQYNEE